MSYSICLIDDHIPADKLAGIRDNELLDASSLQLILNQVDPWPTEVIKNLIQSLLDQREDGSFKWDVTACTHPSIYLQDLNNETARVEILVYDWDYKGSTSLTDTESALLEILQKTFCLVFIFSGADMKDAILAVLAKPEFEPYKTRINYLNKEQDSVEQSAVLLKRTEGMYKGNFSFKFARDLRMLATNTIDSILIDMGRASLSDVSNHIGCKDETEKKDFVDFLSERFRATIASEALYALIDKLPDGSGKPDPHLAAQIWSNRLYFNQETDDLARKGDIIEFDEAYYLVISADCDLTRFWNKNLGIVNCIELHAIDKTNNVLIELLTQCIELKDIIGGVRSLCHKNVGGLPEGPFILPYVPFGDTKLNLFAIPKSIHSFKPPNKPDGWADLNSKAKGSEPLQYSHWPDVTKICTVSEPFLTPVIEHILNNIRGYGVPNYDASMRELVKGLIEEFTKEAEAETT